MTDTLSHPSAVKDISTGILFCLLIMAVIYISPLMGTFAWVFLPLPVLFYRLKAGRMGGGIIMAASLVILVVVTQNIAFDTIYFTSLLLTGFALGEFIEKQFPIEQILGLTVLSTGAVCFALVFLMAAFDGKNLITLLSDWGRGYDAFSTQFLNQSLSMYPEMSVDPEAFKRAARIFATALPSIFICSYLTVGWINILMMRFFLKRKNIHVQCIEQLNQWKTADWLVFGIILSGVCTALLSGVPRYLAVNGLIVLLFIYFFQGIAVVSYFFQQKNAPSAIRFFLYALIAVQPIFLLLVIFLGLFDTWANFRKLKTVGR